MPAGEGDAELTQALLEADADDPQGPQPDGGQVPVFEFEPDPIDVAE